MRRAITRTTAAPATGTITGTMTMAVVPTTAAGRIVGTTTTGMMIMGTITTIIKPTITKR